MTDLVLTSLRKTDEVARHLTSRGLSLDGAHSKAKLFARAATALEAEGHGAASPALACYVPGRIELLGKHTDYAGGRSLLLAPERGFCIVAVPRTDATISITSVSGGESTAFEFRPDLKPREGHWSNYPISVAARLALNFPGQRNGANMALESDLPAAAGMSSSSALVVATYLALAAGNTFEQRPEFQQHIQSLEDLAGYLGTIENGQSFGSLAGARGVGTFGGSEDHTAILCAAPGVLKQFSFCPVHLERIIPLPGDYRFVIASSGVKAEKTGAAMEKYNRVSRLASAALHLWQRSTRRHDRHLAAAIASAPDAADRFRTILTHETHDVFDARELLDRFEQFVMESEECIPAVADHLTDETLSLFAKLANRSQDRGAELLGNQVPETVYLAEAARRLGAVAASAFGAGFGGSVWALSRAESADELLDRWREDYRQTFPAPAERSLFFATVAGPGAFCLQSLET